MLSNCYNDRDIEVVAREQRPFGHVTAHLNQCADCYTKVEAAKQRLQNGDSQPASRQPNKLGRTHPWFLQRIAALR